MLKTSIDTIDHRTERKVDVPPEFLEVVARADGILREQFMNSRVSVLEASWCRFENVPGQGWCVQLDVFTPVYGFGQQFRIEDLRDPTAAKRMIWSVLDEFAQTYSDKVDEQLRTIRADLKQLRSVGAN
jgi:hypothetical protein